MRKIILKADIEEIQIPEQEVLRINKLARTDDLKEADDMIDAKCMKLTTYVNEKKTGENSLYDFQNSIPYVVEEKNIFLRTVYVSPVEHTQENLYLDYILSNSEMYEEMLLMLRAFDENIIGISAILFYSNICGTVRRTAEYPKKHKMGNIYNYTGRF